jgi:uncharacterized repeat protein (TIGR04138 family)
MQKPSFEEIVTRIVTSDPRYTSDAFFFVRDALDHTQAIIAKEAKASKVLPRHVSGQELLEGIRQYALTTYGPMALALLTEWRLLRCEDFGEIVFLLVEHGALSKTDKDQRTDFQDGYDFQSAFRQPFLPKNVRNQSVTTQAKA